MVPLGNAGTLNPKSILHFKVHFGMDSPSVPIEQGRIVRPKVPKHLRRFRTTNVVDGDCNSVFDCPHLVLAIVNEAQTS